MSQDLQQLLKDFKPKKDYFIGIDSDGCAFDTMEIKHKECFCPNTINHWNLQIVSKYARDAWEFVNLYSKTRGCNRFLALLKVMELLQQRKEVNQRKAKIPALAKIREWTEIESKLSSSTLDEYRKKNSDPELDLALKWSNTINDTVADMVHDIPPFPFMRESLIKLYEKADAMVISSTPVEALEREWNENDIAKYVEIIAGQEHGNKKEHLKFSAKDKYPENHILMIGDAPGDLNAAKANNVLFYPINPGHEEASWERFFNESLERFFNEDYAGEYESKLIMEFDSYLPNDPDWETI